MKIPQSIAYRQLDVFVNVGLSFEEGKAHQLHIQLLEEVPSIHPSQT